MAQTDPGGWAKEFLDAETEGPKDDWSHDFLSNQPSNQMQAHVPPMKWAEEYLDQTEHRPW